MFYVIRYYVIGIKAITFYEMFVASATKVLLFAIFLTVFYYLFWATIKANFLFITFQMLKDNNNQ